LSPKLALLNDSYHWYQSGLSISIDRGEMPISYLKGMCVWHVEQNKELAVESFAGAELLTNSGSDAAALVPPTSPKHTAYRLTRSSTRSEVYLQLRKTWVTPQCSALLRPPPSISDSSGRLLLSPQSKHAFRALLQYTYTGTLKAELLNPPSIFEELCNRVDTKTTALLQLHARTP
jgi:hypothetical protein